LCPNLNLNSAKSFNQKCCQTIGLQSIDLNFWRLSNGLCKLRPATIGLQPTWAN
jgi:hypothetical protein